MSSRSAALLFCTLLVSCAASYAYVDADPDAPPGSVACVEEGGRANWLRSLSFGECYTDIIGVDSRGDHDQFVMQPGKHDFTMNLIAGTHRFHGRIALDIPTGKLLVVARCNEGQFELRLVQLPDGKLLAQQFLLPNKSSSRGGGSGSSAAGAALGGFLHALACSF